jgi:hypothetical protein
VASIGISIRYMKMTTPFHLKPRLRIWGAILSLPLTFSKHDVSLSAGTTLKAVALQFKYNKPLNNTNLSHIRNIIYFLY